MASEYDIYRKYAGMDQEESNLDYFMRGLVKIQDSARADKRLALQERAQDRADETVEFNKKQAIADSARRVKLDEDNEFKMMLQYAQNPDQRAMIARARGKEELALGFDKQAKEQEDANNIYKRMYRGTEEEMLSASTEMLSKIPINSHTEGMHRVAAQRQNAMFGSIRDTDDEILSSKYAIEYDNYKTTLSTVGISEAQKAEAMSGIKSVREKYRKDEQERFRSLTKMPTSVPQVDGDVNEKLGDYIMDGSVGSGLVMGGFFGDEQPSFPIYADELEEKMETGKKITGESDLADKGESKIQYTSIKPLDKDASVQDYVDAYKGKGESEVSSRVSREGSIISKLTTPSSEWKEGKVSDRYKAYVGLEKQLNSADRDLSNLQRTKGGKMIAGVSKKEWDKQYKKSASMYKKSLQDIYNLYQQLEEGEVKSKKEIKKAGSVRGKESGANNWFKNSLKNILMNEKKRRSDASFYEVYNIDPEIKEILDSIQL